MRLFRLELKRVEKTRTTWMLLAAALLISVLTVSYTHLKASGLHCPEPGAVQAV